MALESNNFDNLINSFKKVCLQLETKADLDRKLIEKNCQEEFSCSVKTFHKFSEIISVINKTSAELIDNKEILITAIERSTVEKAVNVPYEIQSDFVKCINSLYNMSLIGSYSDKKLINEKSKKLVDDIIKSCEKNIQDMEDIDIVLDQAKETL